MKCLKLFVAIVAMFAAVACSGGSPSDVAVKQTEYMLDNNIDGLLDLCDMTKEKKDQLRPMIGDKLKASIEKEITKHNGVKGVKAIEEVISEDGNSATVTIEIAYGDGTTDTDKVELVLVDGKWLLPDPTTNK